MFKKQRRLKMLNSEAINFIKGVEKLVLFPYKEGSDRWTIGYGNTFYENGAPVKQNDPHITKERALQLFTNISNSFYNHVKAVVTSDANNNQVSALTSLAYNIGFENFKKSTLLKLVNQNPNDFVSLESHFLEHNKAQGKISKGLIIRRNNEFSLYKKKI